MNILLDNPAGQGDVFTEPHAFQMCARNTRVLFRGITYQTEINNVTKLGRGERVLIIDSLLQNNKDTPLWSIYVSTPCYV